MSIFDEDRHRWCPICRPKPPLPDGKKRPVVKIRSPYLPAPNGNCKQCGKNHSHNHRHTLTKSKKPKPTDLADLFWPQEEF